MDRLPPPLKGAAYMMMAGIAWTAMLVIVRVLSDEFSVFVMLLWRNVVALALLVPVFAHAGWGTLRTRRLPLHVTRAVLAYAGMVFLFFAIENVPLADVVALSFTQPLFIVIMAALLLGEVVDRGRWAATALGFAGVLVIMRPGFQEVGLPTLAVLASAAVYAGSNVCIKALMRTDSPAQALFLVNLLMLPLALAPAILFWRTPDMMQAAGLFALGLSGGLGVFFVSNAYKAADASAVIAYDFLRLPMTAAAAWLLFSELPEIWTWLGAGIIFAATWGLARLEGRKARAAG